MAPLSRSPALPQGWKEGIYEVIRRRRDIRAQFTADPIPEAILARILGAAHQAPSVGFMQPWDFLLIRDGETRRRVKAAFEEAHDREAGTIPADRREQYLRFKLEGILESPLNLCVTCDRSRFGEVRVGRTAQPEMDRFSSVCATQNLWLAARAEGIGVGWVSIVDPSALKCILGIPARIRVIAYLCLGYVSHFPEKPELEEAGWIPRLSLESLVHSERWEQPVSGHWPELAAALEAAEG